MLIKCLYKHSHCTTLLTLLFLAACTTSHITYAVTFTVNSTSDLPDLIIDGNCNTGMQVNSQPECSLRAAVQEANSTTDLDNIHFNISEGCVNNICTINITTVNSGFIPDILAPVIIDGSTQPGNSAVCSMDIPERPDYRIVLDGDAIDIGLRLELGSDGSTIRGLNIRDFFNSLAIIRSDNNHIECNFIGTNESGTSAGPGSVQNGIIIGCDSNGNVIGGAFPQDGNLLSANGVNGIQFFTGFDCAPTGGSIPTLNAVLGNFIGTQKDGLSPLGNTFDGIAFFGDNGAENNFIGVLQNGSTVHGNVIGANSAAGIFIDSIEGSTETTNNTIILGNYIGTDRTGTVNIGNAFGGIDIFAGTNTVIGGVRAIDANKIAFNREGVFIVDPSALNNRIQRNAIYQNNGLGIDLVITGEDADGQNMNDPGDADIGPNQLQNFPEITSASQDAGVITINYSVPSISLPLTIEFFQTDADNEEGQVFLSADEYLATGMATHAFSDAAVNVDTSVIATATDINGNTSEFSLSVDILFLDLQFRDGFE